MFAIRKVLGWSAVACLGGALTLASPPADAAWKPTRTVEFIVPAGIGGGAGQMAQLIQGIITKHNLMPTSMVVISKKGGSGAEDRPSCYARTCRGRLNAGLTLAHHGEP